MGGRDEAAFSRLRKDNRSRISKGGKSEEGKMDACQRSRNKTKGRGVKKAENPL